MKKQKIILAGLLSVSALKADFTFSLSIGAIYADGIGVDIPTQITSGTGVGTGGTIGVTVVDVSNGANGAFPQGDALAGKSLAQYANWGSSFYVMNILTAIALPVSGDPKTPAAAFNGSTSAVNPTLIPGANTNGGHPFAVYWFPSITDTNASTNLASGVTPSTNVLVGGTSYGFFTSNVALHTGLTANNNAFVTPANGATNRVVQAKNADAIADASEGTAGTIPATNLFLTNQIIPVPEPSTYALMGLGLVVVGLIARRKKA